MNVLQDRDVVAANLDSSRLTSISTQGIKASERGEFWKSRTSSLFGSLRFEMQNTQPFDASLQYTGVADLIFCRLSASVPHRVTHDGNAARRDDQGLVKAVLQTRGSSVVEQSGSTTVLRAGEWTIYDIAKPYSIVIPNQAEMLILMIPREKLFTREVELQELAGRRLSGRQGLGKLMWSLVPAAFEQIPAIRAGSSYDVADLVTQMIRLALVDSLEQCAKTDSKDALRERLKLYIEGHLRDADLSISKLASFAHCSKRYLHMAFQPERSSISEYILKLRLGRCLEDLRNPAFAHRSITDIAYSWGFNSSNHFSRCFKQVYGVSPRHSRAVFEPAFAHGDGRHRRAS